MSLPSFTSGPSALPTMAALAVLLLLWALASFFRKTSASPNPQGKPLLSSPHHPISIPAGRLTLATSTSHPPPQSYPTARQQSHPSSHRLLIGAHPSLGLPHSHATQSPAHQHPPPRPGSPPPLAHLFQPRTPSSGRPQQHQRQRPMQFRRRSQGLGGTPLARRGTRRAKGHAALGVAAVEERGGGLAGGGGSSLGSCGGGGVGWKRGGGEGEGVEFVLVGGVWAAEEWVGGSGLGGAGV